MTKDAAKLANYKMTGSVLTKSVMNLKNIIFFKATLKQYV